MDKNRTWKILNWNLRGIILEKKWLALSSKIEESGCDIICLQETKRKSFTMEYIRKFCPNSLISNFFLQWVPLEGF
jgi:exonuclease III